MRKYHLSYDVISDNDDFDFVEKHLSLREKILTILKKLGAKSVTSPCESTIIFTFPNRNFNLNAFEKEAKKHIYFSICLVAQYESVPIEKINESLNIDDEILQDLWNSIQI
ncbi:hypothetical protein ELOC111193_18640 [Elizabethkingia occulta]|uniref:Uncharacterized protein n=1 Tax=Elizabethkingia occulta TaxID=1867263 RepID=A0A1T3MHB4_9FLAO|nr:hypothetical protein [Elizabethkingia occulta]OPC63896.1 hypothetical protein BAZ10_07425 [Elizabethkingia occulta]